MAGIFISYRRDDSAAYAGRLYDRLCVHFGKEQVFMDIDHIEPGEDFVRVLIEKVNSCDACIVLIGKTWITSSDKEGRRRLDDPDDYVRLEVSTALNRNARVIPVLVGGAGVPAVEALPESITLLSRRNAMEISDTRFHQDVDRLIEVLSKTTNPTRSKASTHVEDQQTRDSENGRAATTSVWHIFFTRYLGWSVSLVVVIAMAIAVLITSRSPREKPEAGALVSTPQMNASRETPARRAAATSQTSDVDEDDKLKRALIGTWKLTGDRTTEGAYLTMTSTLLPDGTASWRGLVKYGWQETPLMLSGTTNGSISMAIGIKQGIPGMERRKLPLKMRYRYAAIMPK